MSKAGAGRQFHARVGGDPNDPRRRRNPDGAASALFVNPPLEFDTETGRLALKPARGVPDPSVVRVNGSLPAVKMREYLLPVEADSGTSIETVTGGPVLGTRFTTAGSGRVYLAWAVPENVSRGDVMEVTIQFTTSNTDAGKAVEFELDLLAYEEGQSIDTLTDTLNSGDIDNPAQGTGTMYTFTLPGGLFVPKEALLLLMQLRRTTSTNEPGVGSDPVLFSTHIDYYTLPPTESANEVTALRSELRALKASLRERGYLEK